MRLDNQDGVSLTNETSDANQNCSLSQDWLDVADAEERVMRNLPRVVASLPTIQREGETRRKTPRAKKIALLRVASSYTATFLLGGICVAFGARSFHDGTDARQVAPGEDQIAEATANEPGLSLDSLAFERAQEPARAGLPNINSSEPTNDSPLRFNDVYDSYAEETPNGSNAFAPQNAVPGENAESFPQVAREEETFPTWADLETNENALPDASAELAKDDYSFAANSPAAPYEPARSNESFQQNYAPANDVQTQAPYNTNYAQNQTSSLQLSAPSAPQYVANDSRGGYNQNGYNQNNNYNGNTVVNSNTNERVYATNAGNTNYNNRRELDDFTTSNATNEGFSSYEMSASAASGVPVFEERQTDAGGYGASENSFANSANDVGTPTQAVDRSFIPTFSAPGQASTQAAPSSSNATYVAQNREEASNTTPVVSSGRPLRW